MSGGGDDVRAEILSFDEVTVGYGGPPVLEGVTFNVRRGEVAGVVALDGRGRSTLLKCAGGLLAPATGRVNYEQRDVYRMSFGEDQKFRARCAMVLEGGALLVNRTVFENVALPLRYHLAMKDDDLETFVGRLLTRVGYTEGVDALPWQVSTRGRKLVAFARALVREPELVLVDRFFEGLEPPDVKRIMELVLELNVKKGTSFLVVAELTPQIFQIAERVVVLEGGKVLAHDFKRALFKIEKVKRAFEEGEQQAAKSAEAAVESRVSNVSAVIAVPLLATDSEPFKPDADSDDQPVVVLESPPKKPKKPRKSSPSLTASEDAPATPRVTPEGAPDEDKTANLRPADAAAVVNRARATLEKAKRSEAAPKVPKPPADEISDDESERTLTFQPEAQAELLRQMRARAEERLEQDALKTESGSQSGSTSNAPSSHDQDEIAGEFEAARAQAAKDAGGAEFTERPTREFTAPIVESSSEDTQSASSGASDAEEK
jgi:ABC-type transporter Mla maintaining outer membrane lipid asymmetry ATPase subunit MlaF